MSVAIEFRIDEAEALLKRLASDPHESMSAHECDAAEDARERLQRAVAIERGPGGSHELASLEDLANALIGERVNVHTTYGSDLVGTLERIVGFRSLLIRDEFARHPINLSLVDSIELDGTPA